MRGEKLRVLAPIFAKDADVYIMACKTGNDGTLLRRISTILGGVRVHGFTNYVYATNYLYWIATVDDDTDGENREIVCWPSQCKDYSRPGHPPWSIGKPFNPKAR